MLSFLGRGLTSLLVAAIRYGILLFSIFFIGIHIEVLHNRYINYVAGQKVVRIVLEDGRAVGTGFYVQANSGKTYLLTNRHVCRSGLATKQQMYAESPQHRKNPLRVIEMAFSTDLCIIEGDQNIKGLRLARNNAIEGELVFTIGHPQGLTITKTRGEVSSGRGEVSLLGEENPPHGKCPTIDIQDMFNRFAFRRFCKDSITSQPINTIVDYGSSGSPVVDLYGQLVGVVFAKSTITINRAEMIPLNDVRDFLSVY